MSKWNKSGGYVFNNPPPQGTKDAHGKMIGVNPIDYVDYMDAGPKGEIRQAMEQNQKEKRKISAKLQSEGKSSLLNQQPTRSKGGGKSGGGGGGKWGWIRRAINRPSSPWSLLKSDKNY